ncbi:prepilin-type N-terminal cleavage/methylation domain-containing protein [Butyrivibrio hungatei DSM 14810]|uniref:Prepilin-type N-terminal cleavage/methylation domain-containing protein n=1 Tax=Butyrivibrio hungatei DSM 14810 TaxID=1121132 RepID=A0A1M7S7M2_9FIRM|nr:type II secretion system protein [Butyrivibrio hungatei]SHN54443.1 prepilin-type N-terminal cleavage/methylation domain-containing protein [Butyrivibrio hungatei DSM 14810]
MYKKIGGMQLKNNKGFTLAELLITIALIGILAGVGALAIYNFLTNNRQAAADKAAESLALAFQNRLQEIYAFEEISEDELKAASTSAVIGNRTVTINTETNNSESMTIEVQYYAIGMQEGLALFGCSDDTIERITDYGQIFASEFYQNGIVIEYDPVNCRVYSVTYLSDTSKYSIEELYNGHMNSIRNATDRKNTYKGYVGYYEIEDKAEAYIENDIRNQINVRIGRYVNGEKRLYNSDKLIANIEIVFPTEGPNYFNKLKNRWVMITVEIEGETSGNTMVFSEWSPYLDTLAYTNIPLVIDGFGISEVTGRTQSFAGQFSKEGKFPTADEILHSIQWSPYGRKAKRVDDSGVDSTSGDNDVYLIPGENIIVKATVASFEKQSDISTDGNILTSPLLTSTASASDNSLFAYDNGLYTEGDNVASGVDGTEYKAFISYGRHLQNLDESSGFEKAIENDSSVISVSAFQARDIDFKEAVDGEELVTDKVCLWFDSYKLESGEPAYFTPILNKYITSYDVLQNDDGKYFEIRNLKIDESMPEKSAVKTLNSGKTMAVPRTFLNVTDYQKTVNGTEVYYRYCAGLFRIFYGDDIKNITLIDPQITGLQKVGADGEADNLVSSIGALAGITTNEVTIENCNIVITGTEILEGEDDQAPTGWIRTVTEKEIVIP